MIKLIASDLDGTLLHNGAQSLPEEIFPLIKELQNMGILFVAASGRQYANMKRMFAPVENEIAYIAENGALALINSELLYQDSFAPSLALAVIQAIDATDGAEFTCSTKDFYYMKPKTEHFRDLMLNVVKNDCKEIKDWNEITEPVMKMAVYERDADPAATIRHWSGLFGSQCTVVTSGTKWVDFIPFDTNKAKGLKALQQHLNIRPEECVVFGDEYNDIAMLEAVPHSFAMSHAKEGVKKHASYETDRVEKILKSIIEAGGDMKKALDMQKL